MAALAVMCAMTMTMFFTACGSDDDDNDGVTPGDTKAASMDLNFNMSLTDDMVKYCDIEVTCNDGTGEKTEKVTTKQWTKTLKSNLPASFAIKRTVRMKANVDLTGVSAIAYTNGLYTSVTLYNAAGKKLNTLDVSGASISSSGKAEKVAIVINEGKLDFDYVYTFDANGNRLERIK